MRGSIGCASRRFMDYAVADHIYACATEVGVVVLDARRGKYSIVPSDRARSLEGVVEGWPAVAVPEIGAAGQTAPSSLLSSLIGGGIVMPVAELSLQHRKLLRDRELLRGRKQVGILTARKALLDALSATEKPEIHSRDVATFFLSVAYATAMLKCRPFEALLLSLRRRKERSLTGAVTRSIEHLRECVKVFYWLRPFAYAESDACLFDSVVLTDFLFRQGVCAEFCIGVRIRPFVAHSWVQTQGVALNDLPEYLAAYTPILSV